MIVDFMVVDNPFAYDIKRDWFALYHIKVILIDLLFKEEISHLARGRGVGWSTSVMRPPHPSLGTTE